MPRQTPYILGLDLGTSSIGWARIGLTRAEKGKPNKILDVGVRIFEAGVEGDIEQGKDSSRAAKRREARQPRRQNWRTQDRKRKLFELLQQLGLLPESESSKSEHRQESLAQLDEQLRGKFIPQGDHDAHQKLTYILRANASEKKLEPHEVGRALYALAQRRGYLSNRKSQDEDEKQGVVSSNIGELRSEMDKMGEGTTLAQYFAKKVKPADNSPERIRRRYTHRDMFKEEFEKIREKQSKHLDLTDEQWEKIKTAIFFQRPLKSQKELIGKCELEPEERRCPECLPVFQEFRILQKVNDLIVIMPNRAKVTIGEIEGAREKLIDVLQTKPKLTAKQAAKVAELPKGASFSLEEHEGLDLIGHRTNVKMLDAFGDKWLEFPVEEQEQIALEVLNYRKPEALRKRATEAWGLSEKQAEILAGIRLEEEYARHSKKALQKLVEKLRQGIAYSTARLELYPEQFRAGEVFDSLQPVKAWDKDIGNPAIIRALTELRKVVNCLIAKHGKPVRVHIEVARDLKNSRQSRKEIHTRNQQNKKRREKAVEAILEELKMDSPRRRDVDKWLLADECNWECPYCGKGIGAKALIGANAEFNIEHIYPRRYLDDSYTNKTIACRKCNDDKGDMTPKQAFSGERYEEILQRVKRFKGPYQIRNAKVSRFETEFPDEDFVARHLNDTRYNAKLAANYLGTLYGGRIDADGNRRILLPTGGLTWMLRTGWQLNDILSDDNEKTRDDHRHHAIDAIVVALSDQSRIQKAAKAAVRAQESEANPFLRAVEYPWNMFKNDVSYAINAINVSHRPTRTISGPLHAESIYSKEHIHAGKSQHRIRKELRKLSAKEINSDQIVDPMIRKLVQEKYKQLGAKNPQQAFAEEENLPTLPNKNGEPIPIRKVRLNMNITARSVGKGVRQRNVASGKDSNYASMVYAILDKDGNEKKWVHEIITRLEAAERYSENLNKVETRGAEKVLIPDEQDGKRRFKFALRRNDLLLVEDQERVKILYRVQTMSANEIQLCPHNLPIIRDKKDPVTGKKIKLRDQWNRITSIDNLRKRNAEIVQVTPSGDYSARKK